MICASVLTAQVALLNPYCGRAYVVWPGLSLRSPGMAAHRGFEDSAPATRGRNSTKQVHICRYAHFREDQAMFTGAMGTLLVLGALAQAGDDSSTKVSKEKLEKAHKAIVEKFSALRRGAPPLTFLDDPSVERSYPGELFFSVI